MSFWSNKRWVTMQGLGGKEGPWVALQSIWAETIQLQNNWVVLKR